MKFYLVVKTIENLYRFWAVVSVDCTVHKILENILENIKSRKDNNSGPVVLN